jgi:hypothetical protein
VNALVHLSHLAFVFISKLGFDDASIGDNPVCAGFGGLEDFPALDERYHGGGHIDDELPVGRDRRSERWRLKSLCSQD